jgi:hypothetical protein
MAGNSLLSNDILIKECLMSLKNNLVFARGVSRQYSKEYAKDGAKVGSTVNIRKPSRYEVTSGRALSIQDSVQQSVALAVDKQYHIGMAFSQDDRTLSLDKFKELHIDPAMEQLAGYIDAAFFSDMYKAVYSAVGVPSATSLPSTLKGFVQAKAKCELLGAPKGTYSAIVDPLVQAEMVEGLKGLFQSSEQIKEQYEAGTMGLAAGCKFSSSASVAKHTIGAVDGATQVKTTISSQGAAAIAVKTITTASITGAYKKGDVVTIGSVYAVNPITRQSTGQLMQFTVLADADAVSNEVAALSLSPAMYSTGQYQNVDSLPQANALVKVFNGTASAYSGIVAPQNLVFHKSAFALASVDLELPTDGAKASRAVDEDAGLSLTMTSQFDINNYRNITRIDFLGGWKCIYPELACRVVGQPA